MNATGVSKLPTWIGKSLAILSVLFAWLLPWSPVLAIAALKTTHQNSAWRRVATVGAMLSVAFMIAVGAAMLSGAVWILANLS